MPGVPTLTRAESSPLKPKMAVKDNPYPTLSLPRSLKLVELIQKLEKKNEAFSSTNLRNEDKKRRNATDKFLHCLVSSLLLLILCVVVWI